jgi:hyaluronate lyase
VFVQRPVHKRQFGIREAAVADGGSSTAHDSGALGAGIRRRTVMGAAVGALALTALPLGRAAADDDVYATMLDRWIQVLVGGDVPSGNADYAAAVAAQDRASQGYLSKIDVAAGRTTPWDDLPLATASANVTSVANRLRAIALSRATPASALHGDDDAATAVAEGVRILCASAYREGQAEYGNWWDWEIGTSKSLGDTCVLLGSALPASTLDSVLSAIDFFVPDPKRMLDNTLDSTGANLVDLCRAVAVRGVLGRDDAKLTLASSSLAGVMDPVLVGDGFHPDGSFIMHTCVAYPGTYGEVLVKGMAELLRLLVGTQWEVAANERDRTVAAVRDFAPFLHGGLMVDSVRGRALSRTAERDADDGFLLSVDVLSLAGALSDAATAQELRSLAKGWLARNTWRALTTRDPVQIAPVTSVLADDSVPTDPGAVGHFLFPDMERIAHRRPGWTFSLALNSDRVARYEFMNGENAKGWHTGDGMGQLYLDGDPFQYTVDYWPTVDAKRLPGTTVDTATPDPGEGGDNDHVPLTGTRWSGGVRLGEFGLASIDMTGFASTLTARKSWLFLDDAVLAAGSGIKATGGTAVETTVDNRRSTARLTVNGLSSTGSGTHQHTRWAHLAGVGGYVFLGSLPTLHTVSEQRTGTWRDLNTGGPTAAVTQPYTTMWLDHGTDPAGASYAYLQLPTATFAATAARAVLPGVEVVALTERAHVFRAGQGLTAAVFFAPGSAAGITVDAPCSVLVQEHGGELRVAVADPSRTSATVTVEIAKHGYGALTGEASEGLTVLSANPPRLLAETGASHGATLTATLRRGGHTAGRRVTMLTPVADASVGPGAPSGPGGQDDGELLTVDADSSAYLAFDVSRLRGTVRRAVLWVYGSIPNDPATRADDLYQTALRAHGPAADDWSGGPGPALGEGMATVYPDWTAFDVTAALTGDASRHPGQRLTLVVAEDTAGHGVRLHSAENSALRPVLEVVTG